MFYATSSGFILIEEIDEVTNATISRSLTKNAFATVCNYAVVDCYNRYSNNDFDYILHCKETNVYSESRSQSIQEYLQSTQVLLEAQDP